LRTFPATPENWSIGSKSAYGSNSADAEAGGAARSPLYRGFTKATFSVRPDQLRSLRAEARRRADRAGLFRPDVSEVVREALDKWLAKARARG
jgi:hypothetical protein